MQLNTWVVSEKKIKGVISKWREKGREIDKERDRNVKIAENSSQKIIISNKIFMQARNLPFLYNLYHASDIVAVDIF